MGSSVVQREVGMIALMRRGLKLLLKLLPVFSLLSWNDCPDEKGIETAVGVPRRIGSRSWNDCPDEKGIETNCFRFIEGACHGLEWLP
jgi:hypothetical protein